METEKEILKLRERLKELSAKRYKRFNVLLKNKFFEKLEKEAQKQGESKAKTLSKMIEAFNL
jgi:hypothetical protein